MVRLQQSVILLAVICQLVAGQTNSSISGERDGKVFSLFSVVQFKNTACRSQSTMSTGQSTVRNGTCFTASECSSKGGSASGNCAAGFGVCCLFLVSSSGTTINNNCTYIRNPGFPSAYSTTSSISYTINKCSSDICYLRLDFEQFTILGTTTNSAKGLCLDSFVVTAVNTGQSIPTICGQNTGQHMYIDIGNQATDTVTLAFTFGTTTSTSRIWEIKVSQITCSAALRPPHGCLQYWSTLTGRITNFNFLSTTGGYLRNQNYKICIRRNAGYCCVQYTPCDASATSFNLEAAIAGVGLTDANCQLDYISVTGGDLGCSLTKTAYESRYCGTYLGTASSLSLYSTLCDCNAPFEIGFKTTNTAANTALFFRGFCLDYHQLPC